MTLSRLSAYNIEDDILRGHFYRQVLEYIDTYDSDLVEYVIKQDEIYRRDLISYRVYGTPEVAWLIGLVAESDDDAEELTAGDTLTLPTAIWIRRAIRQFIDEFVES